jgi:hypothetical protein
MAAVAGWHVFGSSMRKSFGFSLARPVLTSDATWAHQRRKQQAQKHTSVASLRRCSQSQQLLHLCTLDPGCLCFSSSFLHH